MKKYLLFLLFFAFTAMQDFAGDPTIDDIVWSKDCGTNVPQVKFSPDGNLIYATVKSNKPLVLATATSATVKQFDGIYSTSIIDLTADGKYYYATNKDTLVALNSQTGELIKMLLPPEETWVKPYSNEIPPKFSAMSISPDGNFLSATVYFMSSVSSHGEPVFSTTLFVWDTHSWKIVKKIGLGSVKKILYSHNGNYLACGSNNIVVYDTKTWQQYSNFNSHTSPEVDISFSPDDSYLASCSFDGYVKIWDMKEKKLYNQIFHNHIIVSVNLFSNSTVIYCVVDSNGNDFWLNICDNNSFKIKYRIKSYFTSSINTIGTGYIITSQGQYIILYDANKYLTYVKEEPIKNKQINIMPNPIDSYANIFYSTNENSNVAIDLFDINTKEIENIYKGYLEAGEHTIPWNPKKIPDGMYFCRVRANGNSCFYKLIIAK
jgi:WD40 repeat protein